MSLEEAPAPAGSEALPIVSHSPAGDGPLSARDAARSLADARYKREAQETLQAEQPEAPPENELPDEGNAAPPEEEAPGETVEPDPVVEELPPIEPPRSWTKEEKEEFATYPREAQEKIARREQERDRSVRQSQNEAAEERKAVQAERSKVEQARQQYETALPILLQSLTASYNADFADIQTIQDVQRLAKEDPFRYSQWDAQQKQVAAVQQEIAAAQQRQASERQQNLNDFMRRESELFAEKAPEIADEARRTKLQSAAVSVLKELGFKDEELAAHWRGEKDISIHDHRLHLLLRDSVQLREMKAKASAVKAVPKPPVQRPGAAPSRGTDKAAQIQALEQQLSKLTGMAAARVAAQITQMRRAG